MVAGTVEDTINEQHPLEKVTFRVGPFYGKRKCEPGWYWDQKSPFEDYDIFYVLAGKGVMTLGSERFELQKSSCLIMRPGDLPKATQDSQANLTVIFMHFSLDSEVEGYDSRFPVPRFTQVGDMFPAESLLYRIMELQDRDVPLRAYEYDCLMKHFFIQLFRASMAGIDSECAPSKQRQMVGQVMAYIREDGGMGIQYEKMARSLKTSPQYLSRMFKKNTGMTLKQFIARTKMERAKELLIESGMTISDVAHYMQFSDVFAFSKSFKVVFGVSPSQFLNHIRPAKESVAPPLEEK
jgi:AraC family transcriptional regulator of arabinose operon